MWSEWEGSGSAWLVNATHYPGLGDRYMVGFYWVAFALINGESYHVHPETSAQRVFIIFNIFIGSIYFFRRLGQA